MKEEPTGQQQPEGEPRLIADAEQIDACPFCGTQPEWIKMALADSHWYLYCHECRFEMKADRRDKVIGMWNRRAERAQLRAEVEAKNKSITELESLSRWREIAVDGLPKEGERVLWLNHHGRIFHNSWERFTNQDDECARRNFTHWRAIDLPTP